MNVIKSKLRILNFTYSLYMTFLMLSFLSEKIELSQDSDNAVIGLVLFAVSGVFFLYNLIVLKDYKKLTKEELIDLLVLHKLIIEREISFD